MTYFILLLSSFQLFFWQNIIYNFNVSGDFPGRVGSSTTLSASSIVSSQAETESKDMHLLINSI